MNVKYKIPVTALLTLAMIMALKWNLPEPKNNKEKKFRFWMSKAFPDDTYNIIIGGDSRAYRGISPAKIEAQLSQPLNGMNFGYASNGFNPEYLDFLVDQFTPNAPRFLVLPLTPHSFTDEAVKNELFTEYRNKGRFDQFKAQYLSGYLHYFAPWKPGEIRDKMNSVPEVVYHQDYTDKGWARSYKVPEDSTVAVDIYTKIFNTYQVNPKLLDSLYIKIGNYTEKGIQVIAFRMPTYAAVYALENEKSGFREIEVKRKILENGGHWIDLNNNDFHTYDGSHLHYKSAEMLSLIIGGYINDLMEQDIK